MTANDTFGVEQSRTAIFAAREQAKFDKAPKVSAAAYGETTPVFYDSDGLSGSFASDEGGWFANLADLRETYAEAGKPRPPYVWGASKCALSLDAESIIEGATEEMAEVASEWIDVASLQTLLDAWCATQDTHCWEESGGVVVLEVEELPGPTLDDLNEDGRCWSIAATRETP